MQGMARTVDDDFGDEDAADGPGVGHKVEGALQGGQAPGDVRLPAREEGAAAERPVQRPHQHARRHSLDICSECSELQALAPAWLGAAGSAAARPLQIPLHGHPHYCLHRVTAYHAQIFTRVSNNPINQHPLAGSPVVMVPGENQSPRLSL